MCAIVGIRRFDGAPVDEGLLRTMAATLAHRGPDDEGYWCDGPVGFGHRRLSIIDVEGSRQPMASSDGRCVVSFNGEIFNYRRLREGLRYPFRTQGDTEVLLAAFLEEGPESVSRLQGQFAYSLFDGRDGSLWLFRDRLGVLPLYYYVDDDVLVFASEAKALLPALPRPPRVDEVSLHDYLAHRSVPAPRTLFEGVRKLPQGHRLHADAAGKVRVSAYWRIPPFVEPRGVTDDESVGLVEHTLRRSVRRALVADVPVGAYLSGGLDSSLIVALMAEATGGEAVLTFSAGFGDERMDELPYAREVSEHLGTRHHEVTVRADDFEELWPRLTWHRDAPVSEPADIAVYRLASLARRDVKVVLSGEGSDELFGGYPKHRFARWAGIADLVPAVVRPALFGTAQRMLPASASRLRIALRAMSAPTEEERIEAWFAPFTREERRRLLADLSARPDASPWPPPSGDLLRRMLYADSHAWLADNLLERGDRMSMAASLELRPPFLDHELVELAFNLPSRVKVHRGQGKWVVKQVAGRYLPPRIVNRRKVGFRVPLDAWFRAGLRTMARDVLLGRQSFVGELMDRRTVAALLERHELGRANEDIRIWTLLSLEIWHQRFFRHRVVAG